MAFWVHVEKGYTIFIVYFSSFKSLARLLKKVLKSCETFKIQDFANASGKPLKLMSLLESQKKVTLVKIKEHFSLVSTCGH